MAKLKQAIKKISDTFNELIVHHGLVVEKTRIDYEYTIEQAKIHSYELRRHTF